LNAECGNRNAEAVFVPTRPTATKAVQTLVDAGVLTESSGRCRDRNFVYADYLDVLKTGTEL